jgi:hypothetical protein
MNSDEAKEHVRLYERHQWTFDADDNGVVYVGGTDHSQSIAEARKNGHNGPIVHVYS